VKIFAALHEASAAETVVSLLVELGWPRPALVCNSDEAIREIDAAGGCDLLLTEVYIPPLGGFTLRDALRDRWPGMKTVFVSTRPISGYAALLKDSPFLPHPLEAQALRECLESLFPPPKPESPPMPEDLAGSVFGKFHIREKLADLDGVEIYRARKTGDGRQVMLHVLIQENPPNPAKGAAFLDEAQAKFRLSHPRVLEVSDTGIAEGREYFCTEFLGDTTLKKLMANGSKIDSATALQIIALAADVFGYCERKNIPLAPLRASAILLPKSALPRLANFALAGDAPPQNPADQMKAFGSLILEALDPSPSSDKAREIARRLTEVESTPLTWEGVESLCSPEPTRVAEPSRPAPAPNPPAPKKQNLPWIPAVASIAAVGFALALWFYIQPSKTSVQVQDLGALVEIPAGPFDYQGRPASLPKFYISKYEVTIAEYQKFLEDLERHPEKAATLAHPFQPPGKSHVPKGWADQTDITPPTPGYLKRAQRDGQYLGAPLTPDSPVFGVDWFDAYAYAKWAGRRLPTEREWEKAARGPGSTRHPWGDTDSETSANLGFDFTPSPDAKIGGEKDGFKRWSRVDSPASDRSGYGVQGMAGNVSEWTAIWVQDGHDRRVPVYRGGNWMTGYGNSTDIATTTRRGTDLTPLETNDTMGFRTAADKPD
jgi:formylglycine-generating enzyme required for sulfatase activity